MKRLAKYLIVLCICTFGLGAFYGCGDKVVIDKTKTQLYVSNFSGGYGTAWLEKAATRFEALVAEESYEDGKKGVQILIEPLKVSGTNLHSTIASSRNNVFFTEGVYYYDFVDDGLLLEITDEVTEKLTQYGETRSIEDKLADVQKNYYKTTDGKYYGVPHYAGYNGIMYDVELFENRGFYFAKNGGFTDDLSARSAGPDGDEATEYDNGLPATYDEFFQLCQYMYENNIQPLVWLGDGYNDYLTNLIFALYADYEGLDQMMLNFTYDGGKATSLVTGFNGNTPIIRDEPLEINLTNGYELAAQAGRFYGTDFSSRMMANSNFSSKSCFNGTYSHTAAQRDFLYSGVRSDIKQIAMMVEGCWWESEATKVFNEMADKVNVKYSKQNRRIGFMPYPKATTEQVGDKVTLYDNLYSLGFINASTPVFRQKVAKQFLQFTSTDASLQEFTMVTSTMKALDYTLSETQKSSLSFYGKSMLEMHNRADIVYPYSAQPIYVKNQSAFAPHSMLHSKIGNTTYIQPNIAMHDNKISSKDIFNGYKVRTQADWGSLNK